MQKKKEYLKFCRNKEKRLYIFCKCQIYVLNQEERGIKMNISIDEKVKEYLKKKGESAITIKLVTADNCCVPGAFPSVEIGKPKDNELDRFKRFDIDGVDIYVHKMIEVKERGLKIYMEGLSFLSRPAVDGVKVL
ncbi:hypothetical protein Teth514_1291 [Thermoanaerobacter sp. X514]|nr:hypothetical protein Teth514_1291 [Thermoanaerobacter sp. X514]